MSRKILVSLHGIAPLFFAVLFLLDSPATCFLG